MSLISILSTMLKLNAPLPFSLKSILGYFLILTGSGVGLFFGFQFIYPFIGYYTAGSFLCFLLLGAGFYLVFKKPKSTLNYAQGIKEVVNHAPALLAAGKNHMKEIVGLLVVLGVVFSHHFKQR